MDVFGDLKDFLKVDSLTTDNNVFRLHYKATLVVLIACSLLVTQKQYFGDPIDCDTTDVDSDIMDTFCWIHSTYTVIIPNGEVGKNIPHQGVGPDVDPVSGEAHERKHHKYYQWVVIVLVIQAFMFYIPMYIWTSCEGGKLKMLTADINAPIVEQDVKKERKDMLVSYFSTNINKHNFYAYQFFTCEILNFINVIGQMYFTNWFLGGEFFKYGSQVLAVSEEEIGTRYDPMDYVFPKVAKCTFHDYGASGSKATHDGLCVLPLNIINEKIYIFLWVWFTLVAIVTVLHLIYRVLWILFAPFRNILLRVRANLVPTSDINEVTEKCEIGDWFLLYMLAKNIDPLIFKEVMSDIAKKSRNPM